MTGVQVQDNASSVLYNICDAVNLAVSSMENLRGSIDAAAAALQEMHGAAQEISVPETATPAPVQWQTGGPQVFEGSGIGRFRQEAQSANDMMLQLNNTQNMIAAQALYTDILSPEAYRDIISLSVNVDHLREKITAISQNRANMGTDRANAGLEELRRQLDTALRQQENLNAAMEGGDLSAVNSAYMELSETVHGTERYIRDNTNEQGVFNQQVEKGSSSAGKLIDSIKKVAAEYLSIENLKKVLDMSDNLAQTTAQLDVMGQRFGEAGMSGRELMDGVYLSAQNARTSMSGMADVVAGFGNKARDAFESPQEIIDFANLVQKQMTIAGVSTKDAADAQMQLAQAFGSGSLSGSDLTDIFGQAPNMIQNISDYMGMPVERIREMASEGGIAADVVKASVFSASDEINERFSQMPATFGQTWQMFKDSSMNAFQPALQRIGELAQNPGFQNFVAGAIGAMALLAGIVMGIFDLIGSVGGFIADNWSVIAPIIGGVIAALIVYNAVMGVGWLTTLKTNAAKAMDVAVTTLQTTATFITTAAQSGLNAALAACPITFVIMGVILFIAALFAVCSAIAKATGIAGSGFGVICGIVAMAAAFILNAAIGVINAILQAIWAFIEPFIGIIEWILNVVNGGFDSFGGAVANLIGQIISWFLSLGKIVTRIIDAIFGTSWTDGLSSLQDSVLGWGKNDKAITIDRKAPAIDYRMEYSNAFKAGANWGDGMSDKISGFFSGLTGGAGEEFENKYNTGPYNGKQDNGLGYTGGGGMGGDAAKTAANTGETAANTAVMADAMDVSNEQLKYLRDIAERDIVNRFTTASIKVQMTNHNNVNSGMDLDGIVDGLANGVMDAMAKTAEGVHI